jgi:hypothetical protein
MEVDQVCVFSSNVREIQDVILIRSISPSNHRLAGLADSSSSYVRASQGKIWLWAYICSKLNCSKPTAFHDNDCLPLGLYFPMQLFCDLNTAFRIGILHNFPVAGCSHQCAVQRTLYSVRQLNTMAATV